jgi:hypothetical protein
MKRLHLHCYKDTFNTQGEFAQYNQVQLESIYIHMSYFNVSNEIGNTWLYFTSSLFIELQPGCYNLRSINTIVKNISGYLNCKFVLSDNGQYYWFIKFDDSQAWYEEDMSNGTDYTSDVWDKSDLNWTIYDMTFFQGLRVWFNFIDELSTQTNSNELVFGNDYEIPITAPLGSA